MAAVGALVAVGIWTLLDDADGPSDAADGRSSDTAPVDADAELPAPQPEPDPDPSTGVDPAIALERVAELSAPSSVAHIGAGAPVLVSTLEGRVHQVDLESGESSVVLDLSGVVSTGGERGLLGLAVDPDGDRLYADYTNTDGDTEIRSWPIENGVPVGEAADGVLHLEIGQPYPNHNGGNLVFGPDGLLWIGTGDGGSGGDPDEVAQDPSSLRGKMLRVEPDPAGGVLAPSTNPAWGGRPEVWGIGLRNPWRYSFDRATNLLWIADVGQNEVEEVTVVAPDADRPNFGWDVVEGSRNFEGTADPAFTMPVVEYLHDEGCSVTGGYVYRGTAIPSLFGWYLFGDFCGGWIRAVPADDPEQVPVELLADAGVAVSFAELADGELLFLTPDGIHRIVAA